MNKLVFSFVVLYFANRLKLYFLKDITLERLVGSRFLSTAMLTIPLPLSLTNQYAYKPTGSTTAALIDLFSHVSKLLLQNPYVHVITFDYSKAFDTISHSTISTKLSTCDLPDSIHNWTIDYLSDRQHCTLLNSQQSNPASINASVVQGSVLGPVLFNLNSSGLNALSPQNKYFKYADDSYLVVPCSNSSTIPTELAHHSSWAASCNLKLNPTKTSEIIFSRKRSIPPPPTPSVTRLSNPSIKILGIITDDKLSFSEHVRSTVSSCNHYMPSECYGSQALTTMTFKPPLNL